MKCGIGWPAITIAGLCAVGVTAAGIEMYEIAGYLLLAGPETVIGDPPKTGKLAGLLFIAAGTAGCLSWSAWRTLRPGTSQRDTVRGWSPATSLLWGGLVLYAFLVYYPLPYHSHHIDRALLVGGLVLAWGIALGLYPAGVGALAASGGYRWIRVGGVNLVIFLLVGETAARVADPLLAGSGLFGDKHTPAELKPHVKVQGSIGFTNSQGFRDRERATANPGRVLRVVALGDSFTWGAGVAYDETFVALLEASLQRIFPGAEVINLGVPGWETPEEAHLLRVYGIRFEPDLVVLNFFVGNDIMRRRGAFLDEPIVVAGQSYYVHTVGNRIHDTVGPDRWFLYHLVNYVLQVGVARLQRVQAGTDAGAEAGALGRPRREYLKEIDERSEVYLRKDTPLFRVHWERTRAALDSITRFLEERGIPLLVVLIPAHEQLDPGLQRELATEIGHGEGEYDYEKPQRVLRAWCEENRVAVADLLPVFRREPDRAGLYFHNDMHWNRAGHALAAEALLPRLQQSLSDTPRGRSLARARS
jgi:lysophospholipase L1-like esterase